MKKLQLAIFFQTTIIALILLSGCATSASSNSFSRATARTSFDVYYGEVIDVRAVEIEGEATMFGRLGGSVIGAALGRGESARYGARRIESAAGAVAGSIAGDAIERRITQEDGLEVIVELDTRETIAVVQASDIQFSPGDRVQVLFGRDGSTRVQPL